MVPTLQTKFRAPLIRIQAPRKESASFKRFVGRVVLIERGPATGKLAAIAEIIDHSRVLIDSPHVPRQSFALKQLTLTPLTLSKLPRAAGASVVAKVWSKDDVDGKWAATAWNKKREAAQKRRSLTDFDRFQTMVLKKQRRRQIGKTLAKTKKSSS